MSIIDNALTPSTAGHNDATWQAFRAKAEIQDTDSRKLLILRCQLAVNMAMIEASEYPVRVSRMVPRAIEFARAGKFDALEKLWDTSPSWFRIRFLGYLDDFGTPGTVRRDGNLLDWMTDSERFESFAMTCAYGSDISTGRAMKGGV